MGADFKLDSKFEKAFLNSSDAKTHLESIGPALVSKAKQIAPDDPRTNSNDLKSKISFEVIRSPRVNAYVGRLLSADFKTNWLHEGTSKIPARPFLRQTAESQGFKIEAPVGE